MATARNPHRKTQVTRRNAAQAATVAAVRKWAIRQLKTGLGIDFNSDVEATLKAESATPKNDDRQRDEWVRWCAARRSSQELLAEFHEASTALVEVTEKLAGFLEKFPSTEHPAPGGPTADMVRTLAHHLLPRVGEPSTLYAEIHALVQLSKPRPEWDDGHWHPFDYSQSRRTLLVSLYAKWRQGAFQPADDDKVNEDTLTALSILAGIFEPEPHQLTTVAEAVNVERKAIRQALKRMAKP